MERLALEKAEKRNIFRLAVIDRNVSVGKNLEIFNRDYRKYFEMSGSCFKCVDLPWYTHGDHVELHLGSNWPLKSKLFYFPVKI